MCRCRGNRIIVTFFADASFVRSSSNIRQSVVKSESVIIKGIEFIICLSYAGGYTTNNNPKEG